MAGHSRELRGALTLDYFLCQFTVVERFTGGMALPRWRCGYSSAQMIARQGWLDNCSGKRRFTRLTNDHSRKKMDNHRHAQGLMFVYIESDADRCYCTCDSESRSCPPALIVFGERW
jgi:hypothetical protein